MIATTVARPTENEAIGRAKPRQLPPAAVLLAAHRRARLAVDRHGIVLLGCAAIRATAEQAGRKVGE